MYKLGIDIGASHIGFGIIDSKTDNLITKKYVSYNRPLKIFNYIFTKSITKRYLRFLIKNIDNFIKDYPIKYIGIGCPGGVDPKQAIFYGSKALVVGKIDFSTALSKYQCQIYVDNDCNCAAIGEANNNNIESFLMITIGTGVGFSLIKKDHNNIFLARDELIWKILNINKIPNTKHEKYISSFKKLSKKYNKLKHQKLKRDAIFKNNDYANHLLEEYLNSFIIGIKKIHKEIPLKEICIGGSFAQYSDKYLKKLVKELPQFHIFKTELENDAGIIGATKLPITRY